ncbi:hypothetical protein AVEN_268572-1 [Araneus ventricosus]|uniref:Uncharacterized protein n=1 Tax=Araneus ventricosus TaxID=182803 RepID=A0A4Y2VZ29_ARAVE|nr:hypothetical protein AVEN_268572-1 [Araneus ventricosus]
MEKSCSLKYHSRIANRSPCLKRRYNNRNTLNCFSQTIDSLGTLDRKGSQYKSKSVSPRVLVCSVWLFLFFLGPHGHFLGHPWDKKCYGNASVFDVSPLGCKSVLSSCYCCSNDFHRRPFPFTLCLNESLRREFFLNYMIIRRNVLVLNSMYKSKENTTSGHIEDRKSRSFKE